MERYRRKKLILIITLLLTISGLSIGFASMSTVLTITAGFKVIPDASNFKIYYGIYGEYPETYTVAD